MKNQLLNRTNSINIYWWRKDKKKFEYSMCKLNYELVCMYINVGTKEPMAEQQ